MHGVSDSPSYQELIGSHTRRIWSDANGKARVEAFLISGMAHGVPLATTPRGQSCGAAGAFFLDVGISSTHHIARFWRLHESLVEMPRAAPVSAPIRIATDGRAFVNSGAPPKARTVRPKLRLPKVKGGSRNYPLDPNAVIACGLQGRRSPGSRVSPSAARRTAARCTRPDHRGGLESSRPVAELIRPSARLCRERVMEERSAMSPNGTSKLPWTCATARPQLAKADTAFQAHPLVNRLNLGLSERRSRANCRRRGRRSSDHSLRCCRHCRADCRAVSGHCLRAERLRTLAGRLRGRRLSKHHHAFGKLACHFAAAAHVERP